MRDNASPFWAGGSPPAWFVSFDNMVDGDAGPTLKFFLSRDYPDGEIGAARAAQAMADRLNAAWQQGDPS